MTMPELALRHYPRTPCGFVGHPRACASRDHVRQNIAISDGKRLAPGLMTQLKEHRWELSVDFE